MGGHQLLLEALLHRQSSKRRLQQDENARRDRPAYEPRIRAQAAQRAPGEHGDQHGHGARGHAMGELDRRIRRGCGQDAALAQRPAMLRRCRRNSQPSPESLTRTIPPIRISTRVAAIVTETRRRKRASSSPSPRAASSGIAIRLPRRSRRRRCRGLVGSALSAAGAPSPRALPPLRAGARRGRAREALEWRRCDERAGPAADRFPDVVQRLGAAHVRNGVEVVRRRRGRGEPLEGGTAPRVVTAGAQPVVPAVRGIAEPRRISDHEDERAERCDRL